MSNVDTEIATAFKTAGEALLALGNLLEKQETNTDKLEQTTPKRKRVIKDKNAPKKNCSSFIHFCNQQRSQLQKENPTCSVVDLSKLMGEKWRALSSEDKAPFQKAADEDKSRYEQEMSIYTPDSDTFAGPAVKKAKSKSPKPSKSTKPQIADTDADAHVDIAPVDAHVDIAPADADADTTVSNSGANGEKDKKKKKKKKKDHKRK